MLAKFWEITEMTSPMLMIPTAIPMGMADHAYAESFKQYRIAQLLCRGSHGREDAELL